MESLGLSLREIEEKYTLSEIGLMAWRSQEQAYQMRSKLKDKPSLSAPSTRVADPDVDKRIAAIDAIEQHLGAPLEDDKGRFSVKGQTGETALKVFAALGLNFPTMG